MSRNIPKLIKATVEIRKIKSRKKGKAFTIAEVKFTSYKDKNPPSNNRIAGNFAAVTEGDIFDVTGEWEDDMRRGMVFRIHSYVKTVPATRIGIVNFLVKFLGGIGNKKANAIVAKFGYDTMDIIEKEPLRLCEIKGFNEKSALDISARLIEHNAYPNTTIFLSGLGLSPDTVLSVYDKLGAMTIEKVMKNPYILTSVKEIDYIQADLVAQKLNFPPNFAERIKSCLFYIMMKGINDDGHLFIPKDKLIHDTLKQLNEHLSSDLEIDTNNMVHVDEVGNILKDIIIRGNMIDDAGKIYTEHYLQIENSLVRNVIRANNRNFARNYTDNDVVQHILKIEGRYSRKFADEQKSAILMALTNRFSILTGGPGTGKTHTLTAILECLMRFHKDLKPLLIAPTGRAAKRMSEMTLMQAQTIHRAIGLKAGSFGETSKGIIENSFIIIDESSMMDASLFCKLMESINIDTCFILLVGDDDQLPSVGAGSVLKNLIESGIIPTVKLTQIFRQAEGSQVAINAKAIIEGNYDDILYNGNSKEDFYFIKRMKPVAVINAIMSSIDKMILKFGYTLEQIQILSPYKNGELGVKILNKEIQNRFNLYEGDEVCRVERIDSVDYFRKNDKVMQTTNNYKLKVFNGEVGNIIGIVGEDANNARIEVDFEDKIIYYEDEAIKELDLAYAVTVHKSQGCEFPVVIMPVYKQHESILNRNLLYTGVTRAKDKMVIIGGEETFINTVTKLELPERYSQIKVKLANGSKPTEVKAKTESTILDKIS